jgi:hypothetical protein
MVVAAETPLAELVAPSVVCGERKRLNNTCDVLIPTGGYLAPGRRVFPST